MNKLLIALIFLTSRCSENIDIKYCNDELNLFYKEEICMKVNEVQFKSRNSIITGIDTSGLFKIHYSCMLRPHLYKNLQSGDLFLKNKNSAYYCFVKNDSCFLGKFECNTYYYNNTITKYKLDFKYKFGDDFVVDSTGLHLK